MGINTKIARENFYDSDESFMDRNIIKSCLNAENFGFAKAFAAYTRNPNDTRRFIEAYIKNGLDRPDPESVVTVVDHKVTNALNNSFK